MEKSGDSFVLREYEDADYEEFASWWDDPPPKSSLPVIGLVSGDMKAVGFLALTDCNFSIITWWMANPNNKKIESYTALRKVVEGLVDSSLLMSRRNIFCYTTHRGMIKLLERASFKNHNGHLVLRL